MTASATALCRSKSRCRSVESRFPFDAAWAASIRMLVTPLIAEVTATT